MGSSLSAFEQHEASEAAAEVSEAADDATAIQIDDEDDCCPLCLDTVTDGFRTPCGHVFCAACLAKALLRKDSCPVCRRRGMHACPRRSADCPLCVAGHAPGVVVPDVYQTPVPEMGFREATLLLLFVLSLNAVLLVAGALCEMGALSFVAFAVVFCVTTLANMALLSRWSCVQRAGRAFERLGALHRAAVERLMRRDPGTSESSTAEREVPRPVPYVKTALYAVSAAVALGLVGFLIHWSTA